MNRFLSITCCLGCALILAGCGSNGESSSASTSNKASTNFAAPPSPEVQRALEQKRANEIQKR